MVVRVNLPLFFLSPVKLNLVKGFQRNLHYLNLEEGPELSLIQLLGGIRM